MPTGRPHGRWRRAPLTVDVPDPPSDLIGAEGEPRIAPKRLLYALARDIERQAGNEAGPPVVLATFQQARHVGDVVAGRYARLARRRPLVAVFGADLPAEPAAACGVALQHGASMLGGWTLVAVGAHSCAALIACDLGGRRPRRRAPVRLPAFHDRDIVTAAARSMLARMTAAPESDDPGP